MDSRGTIVSPHSWTLHQISQKAIRKKQIPKSRKRKRKRRLKRKRNCLQKKKKKEKKKKNTCKSKSMIGLKPRRKLPRVRWMRTGSML